MFILDQNVLSGIDRVVVVGTTGVGKSTVARQISLVMGLPVLELDAFRWGPNWKLIPDEEFREKVIAATAEGPWVVDGNYGLVRDVVWSQAQAIIWLDYPFYRIFWQLLFRTFQRRLRREVLWSGNVESLWRTFFTKDSILLWAIRSHPQKKAQYPSLLQRAEKNGKRIIRITNPRSIFLVSPP